jgi:hypothetical protein
MTASDLLSAHFALPAARPDEDAFYRAYEPRPVSATPIHLGILSRAASLSARHVTVLLATVVRSR